MTAGASMPALRPGVPILMYHEIAPASETSSRLAVPPEAFAEQMAYLHDAGFETVTAGRLAEIMAGPARRVPDRLVVLTFDDGFEDFHRQAMPVLDAYGYTATVFVTTGWVQDAGPHAAGRRPGRMLSWSQIAEAAQAGLEVGAHSWQHPQLDQLRGSVLREELYASKSTPRGPARRVRARSGLPVRVLQRPGPAGGPRRRLRLRLRGQQRHAGPATLTCWPCPGSRSAGPRACGPSRTSRTAGTSRRSSSGTGPSPRATPWPAGSGPPWAACRVTSSTAPPAGAPGDPGSPGRDRQQPGRRGETRPPARAWRAARQVTSAPRHRDTVRPGGAAPPASGPGLSPQAGPGRFLHGPAPVHDAPADGRSPLPQRLRAGRQQRGDRDPRTPLLGPRGPLVPDGRGGPGLGGVRGHEPAGRFHRAQLQRRAHPLHPAGRIDHQEARLPGLPGQRRGFGRRDHSLPARRSTGGGRRMRNSATPSSACSSSAPWSSGRCSPCRTACSPGCATRYGFFSKTVCSA